MELIKNFFDILLHIDVYLDTVIRTFGIWTYLIIFVIIFCETGLVITPVLPGDSLLFAAGALAAKGIIDIKVLLILAAAAAIGGDTLNYWIGHFIGPKIFHRGKVRFLNREYLSRAHNFYEKYGGKTIVMARFIPIIRTFAPFVAGIGSMTYWKFLCYNIAGGIAWILICLLAGYFFGNIRVIKEHFSIVIMAIIFISVLPAAVEYIKTRLQKKKILIKE